jgi:RsiW-degrading membrane proteinase PrsW (M82 family)
MPQHDPIPPHLQRAALAWARYKKLMRWMVLAAVVAALLALLYLWSDGGPMPLHMIVATFAGVSLSVLLGTGLMGLVFLSNSSGHDEAATTRSHREDD